MIRDLYESGERNFVVKLVYHGMDVDEVVTWLSAVAGQREGEEMTLGDLVAWLMDVARPSEVRVSTSFAAVDWASPASWGSYSWPYKTLAKYGLDKVRGFYLLVEPGDVVKRALLSLYKGFGVAVVSKRLEMGEWLEEEGRPLLVFLDSRLEPKRNVIFVVTEAPGGYSGYALVSAESIIPALQEHGFEAPQELEPHPGVKVYMLRLGRTFESRSELDEFLRRLSGDLAPRRFLVYKHDMVGMEGLPERVYEKVAW